MTKPKDLSRLSCDILLTDPHSVAGPILVDLESPLPRIAGHCAPGGTLGAMLDRLLSILSVFDPAFGSPASTPRILIDVVLEPSAHARLDARARLVARAAAQGPDTARRFETLLAGDVPSGP